MNNKIGVALYNNFRASFESFLNFLRSMDVDFIEIGKEWIPHRKEIRVFKDLLEIYQLEPTLHFNDDYNLAEKDRRKWNSNILGVLGNLSVCYDLEIKYGVLHCGWVTQRENIPKGQRRFGKAYNLITNFAEDLGVIISLENQCPERFNYYVFQDHKDINEIRKLCEPNEIYFTLDVGHLGRIGSSMDEMISSMDHKLVELHLHDYRKSLKKDHITLGTGELDTKGVLKLIEEKTLIALENRSVKDIRDSILYLRKLKEEIKTKD